MTKAADSVAKKRYCGLSWMWSFSYRIIRYFASKSVMTRTCTCLFTVPTQLLAEKILTCSMYLMRWAYHLSNGWSWYIFLLSEHLLDLLSGPFKILLVLQSEYYKITGKSFCKKKKKYPPFFAEQEGFSRSWNVLVPQPPTECVAKLNTSDTYSTSCHVCWCDPMEY